MPELIAEKNPERRNLLVTSFAFIIFCVADGSVNQDGFRLAMASVTFGNVFALHIFAWAMLIWFGLRYYQTHPFSKYQEEYRGHLIIFNSEVDGGARYIEKELKIPGFYRNGSRGGFRKQEIRWEGTKLAVGYNNVVEDIIFDSNDQPTNVEPGFEEQIVLSGLYGRWLRVRYFLSFAITTPGFTSYAVPYFLFAAAVILPFIYKYNVWAFILSVFTDGQN